MGGGRGRGGGWLSGLRPDAVSGMRLRALGGAEHFLGLAGELLVHGRLLFQWAGRGTPGKLSIVGGEGGFEVLRCHDI